MSRQQSNLSSHLLLGLLVGCCLSAFLWASWSRLDIVALANGEVIPSSQVKQVQHLEGGLLKEILVREGQEITAGQPLALLESTNADADLAELNVRLAALQAEILRLDAELEGLDQPDFSTVLKNSHPDLVARQTELFTTRLENLKDQIAIQKEAIRQRGLEAKEIKASLKDAKAQLALVEEQVKISESLLEQALSNRYQHLDLLKKAQELRGRIDQSNVAAERALAARDEAKATKAALTSGFEKEARQSRSLAQRSYDELRQRLQKLEDSQQRSTLRSPVDGIVKTLYHFTEGGVLKPGDPFADIVPAGDRLVIEAALPTGDIGYVKPGQTAKVRLASNDAMRFSALDGTVESISPDTIITPDGLPFYKVRILTDQDRFERTDLAYKLYPGMTVSVGIQTGTRTVLDLLSKSIDSLISS